MTRPKTRDELLWAAEDEFAKLHETVASVPTELREQSGACEEWSVKDLLAHLDSWHEMFLRWEAVGSTGSTPSMPAVGYTWAQIPALNQLIFETHQHDAWDSVEARLDHSYQKVLEVIASYTDEELFTKKRYGWTGSTSIGSYAISASSSHYAWARKEIRSWLRRKQQKSATAG